VDALRSAPGHVRARPLRLEPFAHPGRPARGHYQEPAGSAAVGAVREVVGVPVAECLESPQNTYAASSHVKHVSFALAPEVVSFICDACRDKQGQSAKKVGTGKYVNKDQRSQSEHVGEDVQAIRAIVRDLRGSAGEAEGARG